MTLLVNQRAALPPDWLSGGVDQARYVLLKRALEDMRGMLGDFSTFHGFKMPLAGEAPSELATRWHDAEERTKALVRDLRDSLDLVSSAGSNGGVQHSLRESMAPPPPAQAPDARPASVAPKFMTWQEAKKVAEAHCDRNPFPGVNALAKIVRQTTGRTCSKSTIRKALDHSPKLRVKLSEHEATRKSVSAVAMTGRAATSTKQERERDPAEAASTDEIFRALVEQAEERERGKLNAMTDSERGALVTAIGEDGIRRLFKPRSQ
jgi:hypothetical protein